jgi:hypothetical protein
MPSRMLRQRCACTHSEAPGPCGLRASKQWCPAQPSLQAHSAAGRHSADAGQPGWAGGAEASACIPAAHQAALTHGRPHRSRGSSLAAAAKCRAPQQCAPQQSARSSTALQHAKRCKRSRMRWHTGMVCLQCSAPAQAAACACVVHDAQL